MPYIFVTLGGKKSSGGFIKIDGDSQIKLYDNMLVHVSEGSHNISFSSVSTLKRLWNRSCISDGGLTSRMAIHQELKAVDGNIDEHFYENSLMTLEVISDGAGNVLSLPKYRMREMDDEEFEKVNKLYKDQCEALAAHEAADLSSTNVTELLLCLFLGTFGAHRFYRKQVGMGILYLFTCGLFTIGVIVDLIRIIIRLSKKDNKA